MWSGAHTARRQLQRSGSDSIACRRTSPCSLGRPTTTQQPRVSSRAHRPGPAGEHTAGGFTRRPRPQPAASPGPTCITSPGLHVVKALAASNDRRRRRCKGKIETTQRRLKKRKGSERANGAHVYEGERETQSRRGIPSARARKVEWAGTYYRKRGINQAEAEGLIFLWSESGSQVTSRRFCKGVDACQPRRMDNRSPRPSTRIKGEGRGGSPDSLPVHRPRRRGN